MTIRNKLLTSLLTLAAGTACATEGLQFIDLTHQTPTFKPMASSPTEPNLAHPWLSSVPIPGFYNQAVLAPPSEWPTNEGHFDSTSLYIHEHHGTHVDAPNHFINTHGTLEADPSTRPRKATHQLTVAELTGKVVLIDVAHRVRRELAKNGGIPSSKISVTDFSDRSGNTVGAKDIEAIADQIEDGVWLVLNLGWSDFYLSGDADWATSPYVNGWNHPGLTKNAVDKLIAIMNRKKVKIAGIAADNLSVDSGESSVGSDQNWQDEDWPDSWPAHVRLLQRNILLVENLANVDQLSQATKKKDCSIIVGAIKHTAGTGAPARVMAVCQ